MKLRSCAVALAVITLTAAGLVGCSSDDDEAVSTRTSTTETNATSSTTTSGSATSTTPGETTSVSLYFVRDEKVGPVGRSVDGASPAKGALEQLVKGPDSNEAAEGLSSTIPSSTRLLGVNVADGLATVDLSSGFAEGGGSLSMQMRVAQVVFTLTQIPSVQKVDFRMDGKPLTVLGGEGLILDHPQTRSDWESMTPAILVESPLPGASLSSPFTVTGTANTFEATFMVTLIDSSGAKVYEHFATATSGTGTRGTFSQSVTFSGAKTGPGTLKVWESSAKDGSETNVVSIPVVL